MKTSRLIPSCAMCFLALVSGCHNGARENSSAAIASGAWIRAELYFGQSMPDGKTISAAEWQRFVDEQITPVFSGGLTILDAAGQYKNRSGAMSREQTKLVIVIYKPSVEKESAIRKLIDEYKRQFRQESVLWTSEKVDARF